ncbi:hypothetical protein [Myroides odoratimimus]|uniref:hypothetical protein n=1 Tax=Myroides odoratimimus TaxID=76832 RepID=UPI0025750C70|nr:hypothetical protein [Myroides odoratimimus]MDM1057881.1 hypothetical protein [Myroides odoratimimus]
MTISQHHLAIQVENEKLRKENEIMRQIASTDGFYDYYFKHITKYPSRIDAFNYVNELYENYFGSKRYKNYWSFKRTVNKKLSGV